MTPPAGIEQVAKASRVAAIYGLRGVLALVVLVWRVSGPLGATLLDSCRYCSGGVLARRFIRLWPVYALCLGMGYLIAGVHPVWSEFFWYPIIGAEAQPSSDPPMWSLSPEAWTMPLMSFAVCAGSGAKMRASLCIAALIVAGLAGLQISVGGLFVAGAFLARSHYRNRFFESTVPQWLGRISYSLYLIRWLVLELATRAFGPWGAVAALPAVFVVGWLVWWGVERPSIWASRRIGRICASAVVTDGAARGTWNSRNSGVTPRSARQMS